MPISTRPHTPLPPLPTKPARHATQASPPANTPAATALQKALQQRRDALVQTRRGQERGLISTTLVKRERTERAFIITTTRHATLIAAQEAKFVVCKDTPLIVAAGSRVPGGWKYPALNANAARKSVVVVSSVRACLHEFLLNGHGRRFLQRIDFLIVADVAGIVEIGAYHVLLKVLKAMTPKEERKTVVFLRPVKDEKKKEQVEKLMRFLLREKREVVDWQDGNGINGSSVSTHSKDGQQRQLSSLNKVYNGTARKGNMGNVILDDENNAFAEPRAFTPETGGIMGELFGIDDGFAKTEDVTRSILSIPEDEELSAESEDWNAILPDPFASVEQGRLRANGLKISNTSVPESDEAIASGTDETQVPKTQPVDEPPESVIGVAEPETPQDVREVAVVGDWASNYALLREMLSQSKACDGEGVSERTLVLFPTARLAECYATMCRADGVELHDVHRRSTAAKRERVMEWLYENTSGGVFFATDMVTKGAVLPRVDRVLHFGAPALSADYVTRLAAVRDGGESVLILGPREADIVLSQLARDVGRMPQRHNNGSTAADDDDDDGEKRERRASTWQRPELDDKARERAYLSWISFWLFRRSAFGWVAKDVVAFVNEWALQTFGHVPMVENSIVKRMPISKEHGLLVKKQEPPSPRERKVLGKPKKKRVRVKSEMVKN